jgi:hypothetical protein
MASQFSSNSEAITASQILLFRELANPEVVNTRKELSPTPPPQPRYPPSELDPVPEEKEEWNYQAHWGHNNNNNNININNNNNAFDGTPADREHNSHDDLQSNGVPKEHNHNDLGPDFFHHHENNDIDELLSGTKLPQGFAGNDNDLEPSFVSSRPPGGPADWKSRHGVGEAVGDDLRVDKGTILHEIKQLQMLNPNTAIVSRELSIHDSVETLQLALFQARQSVDISSGVDTMKNFLKVGCTGLELGCNKFAKKYVNLSGWSSEVANDISGQSYNAPLQQIYRRYWRAGGSGMNPFLQLFMLLIGSAAVFALKRHFMGPAPAAGITPPPAPPQHQQVPFDSNAMPMPHNRPMRRPTPMTPPAGGVTGQPSAETLSFDMPMPPTTMPSQPPPMMPGGPGGFSLDPQMLQQSLSMIGPMLGPMMKTMGAMSGAAM